MGAQVTLVNPAYETALELKELLQREGIAAESAPDSTQEAWPEHRFFVSDLDVYKRQIFGRFRRIQIRIDSGAQGRITGLAYGAVFLIEHYILILTLAFRLIQSQIGAVIQGLEIFSVIR